MGRVNLLSANVGEKSGCSKTPRIGKNTAQNLHFRRMSARSPLLMRQFQGEESTGRQSRPMPVYDVANTG